MTPAELAERGVRVKALVWNDGGGAEFYLRANGYCIGSPTHDYARLTGNGLSAEFNCEHAAHSAKAAANADHIARICAALEKIK